MSEPRYIKCESVTIGKPYTIEQALDRIEALEGALRTFATRSFLMKDCREAGRVLEGE